MLLFVYTCNCIIYMEMKVCEYTYVYISMYIYIDIDITRQIKVATSLSAYYIAQTLLNALLCSTPLDPADIIVIPIYKGEN